MVTDRDIVLLYTYSGETDEIVRLFPSFKNLRAKTVLITGRKDSSAGREADVVLDVHVDKEACPNNLAPTTSTTVMMAVSDALAVAVQAMNAQCVFIDIGLIQWCNRTRLKPFSQDGRS